MPGLERAMKEDGVKADYKKTFLAKSFATEQDFERIWQSSLRDEAIKAQALGKPEALPESYLRDAMKAWNTPD